MTAAVVQSETDHFIVRLRNECEHDVFVNINWPQRSGDTIIVRRPYGKEDTVGIDLSATAPMWQFPQPRWQLDMDVKDGITFTERIASHGILWFKVLKMIPSSHNERASFLVLITDKNTVTTLPLLKE